MKDKMTVKEFFENGYKFVEGDSFVNNSNCLFSVGHDTRVSTANEVDEEDAVLYVISAKALEESHAKVLSMQAAKEACVGQIGLTELIDFDSDFNSFVIKSDCNDTDHWDEEFIKVIRAIVDAYDGK